MPIRMLRDWTDSESVNALSASAETLFVRLIMKADDYGCFHAHPSLIKSFCFPLKESIRNTEVSRWVEELQSAGLIAVYVSPEDGKNYLQIVNFGQRLKQSRHKFPPPPDEITTEKCQLPGTSGNFRLQNRIEHRTQKESVSIRTCAQDAERIAGIYPQSKIGNFRNVISAVAEAITRECDRPGVTFEEAVGIVESGTIAYSQAVKQWPMEQKRYISDAVKFFNNGIYNNDPEVWERQETSESVIPEKTKTKKYDFRDPSTWKPKKDGRTEKK